MRTCFAVVFFLSTISLPLLAQSYPQVEVFGGYQYNRQDGAGFALNQNGWDASITGNFSRFVGVTGDFGGFYKTSNGVDFKTYTYALGPVLSLNHEGKVNPFVHALVGRAHFGESFGASASVSSNAFTMMYGGGADVKLNPRFAFRIIQTDWVFYHFSGTNLTRNARISTGIVFRL
jgi:hypothetical protein